MATSKRVGISIELETPVHEFDPNSNFDKEQVYSILVSEVIALPNPVVGYLLDNITMPGAPPKWHDPELLAAKVTEVIAESSEVLKKDRQDQLNLFASAIAGCLEYGTRVSLQQHEV